jgi:hypothetical protein
MTYYLINIKEKTQNTILTSLCISLQILLLDIFLVISHRVQVFVHVLLASRVYDHRSLLGGRSHNLLAILIEVIPLEQSLH